MVTPIESSTKAIPRMISDVLPATDRYAAMVMLDMSGIIMYIQVLLVSLPAGWGGAASTTGSVGSCGRTTLAGRWKMIRDISVLSHRTRCRLVDHEACRSAARLRTDDHRCGVSRT